METVIRHCGDESEHEPHEWELPGAVFSCVGTTAEGAELAKRLRFSSLPRMAPAPPPIVWGATLCKRKRCVELAEVGLDGEPFCVPHADEEIDRACVDPDFARLLPGLDE